MLSESFEGKFVNAASTDALAVLLAKDVAHWLSDAISQRDVATLVVSGGSTPAPFFKALSVIEIDWSRVKVTLADERWVAPGDPLSNETFVRKRLLVNAAAAAQFVSIYNDAKTPDAGWSVCEASIAELPQPFDVVILGMGGDGHTASLFPSTKGLEEACDLSTEHKCWPMYPVHLEEARMTLTLAALINCRQLVLHMTGNSKTDVFNQAIEGADYPIASVVNAAKERLQVYWAA